MRTLNRRIRDEKQEEWTPKIDHREYARQKCERKTCVTLRLQLWRPKQQRVYLQRNARMRIIT
jgi:hypothetical protein